MGEAPELTLLVPCFNEAAGIDRCLQALASWAQTQNFGVETVVIDDGSADDTQARVLASGTARCIASSPNGRNVGKGAALRAGVREARGHYVAFLDADLAVGPDQLPALVSELRTGADVAAGCRTIPGAAIEGQQPLRRRLLGRVYLKIARRLLRLGPRDVTCGFKGFRRDIAQDVFARTRAKRWGLDAEVLYLARKLGLDVREVPVVWIDGGSSRVRLLRDVPASLLSLFGTWWRHRRVAPR